MYIDTQISIWLTGTLNKSKGKSNPYKGSEFIFFLNNSASSPPPPDGDKSEKESSQKKLK